MRIHPFAGFVLLAMAGSAHAGLMYGSSVSLFQQGLKKGGGAVDANRSITANALGAPQNNDTINFVALGFGGSLVLGFDAPFRESVSIWETTFGNPAGYPEAADVYVGRGASPESASYFFVGRLQNTADGTPMSLASIHSSSGFNAFHYLRIVDATNPALHNNSADGFDVDAVAAMAVPAPGAMALLLPACGILRRRRR